MAELVIFEQEGHVATLRLNRPESRNALSSALLKALAKNITNIAQRQDIRAVVISGTGEKAFSAGADLKERHGMLDEEIRVFLSLIQGTFQSLAKLPMPVIAAMNGDAFGGGLELALACDIRIAAHHAMMGLTECSLGIIPGAGGTQRLPRIVGMAKACELIFAAVKLNAYEAMAIGLVNHVAAPTENIHERAQSLAQTIANNAPLAVRVAKRALRGSQEDLKEGLIGELKAYEEILMTTDRLEGLKAFAEKRKPKFSGS